MDVNSQSVFVTGGTGTIGRKVVEKLVERKYTVTVLSRKKGPHADKVKYILGDINDEIYLKKCDYIIHLAANLSHGDKEGCHKVNVRGTENILKLAKKLKIKKMVHVSTIMVFADNQGKKMSEKSKKVKHSSDPYTDSKAKAETTVRQSTIPAVIVYPTVVIDLNNRGEPKGNIITKWLWKFSGGFNGCLNGLIGSRQRMINYVLVNDVAEGIILALEKGKVGQGYILGGENLTIGQYFNKMTDYYHTRTLPIRLPGFLGKTKEMNFSSQKARDELGYKPKTIDGFWVENNS